MNKKIQEKIKQLLAALNKDIFEKEEAIRLTLLTAIAGESIFLLGRPGVAKSLIARRLKFAFEDANSFEYLMNRFSTPDEIFGPISIKKLKDDDKYERLTDNYLPQAHVAFLDEIWKAGPSIQNALLTIINEKVYRNGEKEVPANLQALIAASNELPEKDQGLEALWDRFLVRLMVTGVNDEKNFESLISKKLISYDDKIAADLVITTKEYKDWSKKIDDVTIPTEVFKVIHAIRKQIQLYSEKKKNEIYISDRRWRKIVRLLRTSAFLNGRKEVDLMDCFLIAHCIWIEQEQINDMQELVADVLKKHGYALSVSLKPIRHQIKEFEKEVREDTIVIKQRWEDEYIVVDNDYYEMDNTDVGSYNKIKIVDFDKLKSNSETSNRVNLYKPNSNRTTNVILRFTEENGLEYHSEAYNYNFNSTWRPLKLKTQRVCKNEKYTQKPNHRLKKQWDIQVKEIKFEIKKQIQKVEIHREKNLPHLRTNSFVNKDFANLIETNLFDIIRNLQDENIEISRIQYYYENIK